MRRPNALAEAASLNEASNLQTILEINREMTGELTLERLLPLLIRRAVELLAAHSGRL